MTDALWYGTPVRIVRIVDSFWIVVQFLEKCSHFDRNEQVCLSQCNILTRTPVYIRRRRWEHSK